MSAVWRTRPQQAGPDAPRPGARSHIVFLVAAFAAGAGAVVTGVVLHLVHPIHTLKPASPPRPPAAAPVTAVSGRDCHGGGANDGFNGQVHRLILPAKSG
jgi:hypothetical protein